MASSVFVELRNLLETGRKINLALQLHMILSPNSSDIEFQDRVNYDELVGQVSF